MNNKFEELTILFVENDPIVRTELGIVLKKLTRNVYIVNNEIDAVNLYNENKNDIDLILCSMNDSDTGALELLKQIRINNKKLSFILISKTFSTNNLMEAIKYNVTDTLTKPIIIKKLIMSLYNACEEKLNKKTNHINEEEVQSYIDALNKVAIVSKTDLKGKITYVNDIFCEIAQYSREELIGKSHSIVRHPDMPKKAFEELWDKLKNRQKWQGKVKNRAKDGSAYFVNATISPLYDCKGCDVVGYIGIRFLITVDENEKREFKKKVIVNFQNTKKREVELLSKIENLENILESSKYLRKELEYQQMRSLKLVNQLNHYEKEISIITDKNNRLVSNSNTKISELSKGNLELKEQNEKLESVIRIQKIKLDEALKTVKNLEDMLFEHRKRTDSLKELIVFRESEIVNLKKNN